MAEVTALANIGGDKPSFSFHIQNITERKNSRKEAPRGEIRPLQVEMAKVELNAREIEIQKTKNWTRVCLCWQAHDLKAPITNLNVLKDMQ